MPSNSVLKLFIMLHILSHVLFVMIPILPLNRQSLSTPEGWHSVFLHGLLKRCPGCPLQSQEPIRTVIISPHYVLLHAHEISSTFLRWATIMYYATKQGSQCGWFLWIINFSWDFKCGSKKRVIMNCRTKQGTQSADNEISKDFTVSGS